MHYKLMEYIAELSRTEGLKTGDILSLEVPYGDFEIRVISKEEGWNLVCKEEDAGKVQKVIIVEDGDLAFHVLAK